ncbi:MAG: hydroxymethylglutaryl-CoA synthase [Candidatus Rokuibacteriota bacterium]|nr:MAG: hydroxymethylglutaryl-CoA synthase [Candidatus Rokubacteria bacterium]
MRGLLAWGAYVPYARLDRKAIAAALGASAGSGTRAVASYDEDSTSMGVEAARAALRATPVTPEAIYFATADPAYLDKTNATAVHAALDLPASAAAYDMLGSVRSSAGATRAALDARGPALAVVSDIRTGLAGGGDEREGGDAAAAFLLGDGDVVAEPLGHASQSAEFLDRWRVPGESFSRQWEERFGEHVYVPLEKEAIADDLVASVGNAGAAHAGVMLAAALDAARPDQVIAVLSLADGADATIWRTTGAVTGRRPAPSVATQVARGASVPYAAFLTWRGFLRREPPRRPDPQPPEAPAAARAESWKYAFTGSRCLACGTRHVPPQRVCVKCHAVDRMRPERLSDVPATIATFTVDRLAYSMSPPVVVAVIDFEGGGRFQCEMTDVDPKSVKIGDRVELTFRRLYTANGIHNYFWKARPSGGK